MESNTHRVEYARIKTLDDLIDHIMFDHEYEDPAPTEKELRLNHRRRHESGMVESHSHPGIRQGNR